MSYNRKNKEFKKSELKSLHSRIEAMVASANKDVLPTRRVSIKTAITVADRELSKNSGSSTSVRAFNAVRAVSSYISLAQRDRVTPVALQNSDLLPVGHPRSTRAHEMSDESVRYAQAQWIASDPLIDDSVRGLVAAAHSHEHGSFERRHAFARLSALGAHRVPLTASVDPGPQPIVAGVLGFVGGNSRAARRLRAQLQRRDRYGKFAYMGGGLSFKIKMPDGSFGIASGRIVGTIPGSVNTAQDLVEVEIANSSVPDVAVGKIYRVPSSKGISAKAILPKEVVESLPGGDEVSRDDVFVTPEQLKKYGMVGAPNGWSQAGSPNIWKSEDGYTVSIDPATKKYSVKRNELEGGQFAPSYDSWSDVQKAVLKDQNSYQKDLKGYNELDGNDEAQAGFADAVAARDNLVDYKPDIIAAQDADGYLQQIDDAIADGSRIGFSYREEDISILPKSVAKDGDKLIITDINGDVKEFDAKQINIELPEKPVDPELKKIRSKPYNLADAFNKAKYPDDTAKYADRAGRDSGGEPIETVRRLFKDSNLTQDQFDTFVEAVAPSYMSSQEKRSYAEKLVGEDALSTVQFGKFSEDVAPEVLKLEPGQVLDLDTSSKNGILNQIADAAKTGNGIRFGYNGTAIELEAPYAFTNDNNSITGFSPLAGEQRRYDLVSMSPFSEDLKPAKAVPVGEGRIVNLFEPFGVTSDYKNDKVKFMQEAKSNNLQVRVNYKGFDYVVEIRNVTLDKKTGRPEVEVSLQTGQPYRFEYDLIKAPKPEMPEAPKAAEAPEAPKAPSAPEAIDFSSPDNVQSAIDAGQKLNISYGGKDRTIEPKRIWTNPKNGQVNVEALDLSDEGKKKNFALGKIEKPSKKAPDLNDMSDADRIKAIEDAIAKGDFARVEFDYNEKRRSIVPTEITTSKAGNVNVRGFETQPDGSTVEKTFTVSKIGKPVDSKLKAAELELDQLVESFNPDEVNDLVDVSWPTQDVAEVSVPKLISDIRENKFAGTSMDSVAEKLGVDRANLDAALESAVTDEIRLGNDLRVKLSSKIADSDVASKVAEIVRVDTERRTPRADTYNPFERSFFDETIGDEVSMPVISTEDAPRVGDVFEDDDGTLGIITKVNPSKFGPRTDSSEDENFLEDFDYGSLEVAYVSGPKFDKENVDGDMLYAYDTFDTLEYIDAADAGEIKFYRASNELGDVARDMADLNSVDDHVAEAEKASEQSSRLNNNEYTKNFFSLNDSRRKEFIDALRSEEEPTPAPNFAQSKSESAINSLLESEMIGRGTRDSFVEKLNEVFDGGAPDSLDTVKGVADDALAEGLLDQEQYDNLVRRAPAFFGPEAPEAPEPELEPEEPVRPDYVSPEVGLEVLTDGLSAVESALGDIPEEDLDNLDDEDSETLTKVNDLLDSAQEAIDSIDPIGSDTNDIHFEQARADLGEIAELLSLANNGDMQNAGIQLQEVVDNFVGLPQIDFSGYRAERDRLTGEPVEETDLIGEFDEAAFDSFFTAPEGAYKPDIFNFYRPKGRTNEASADYTDDPEVLASKFSAEDLARALRDAVLPSDGESATGFASLPFDEGDESVKAEAIYEALDNAGFDANTVLAGIYDSAIDLPEGQRNVDNVENIEPPVPDDLTDDLTKRILGETNRDNQIRLAKELNGEIAKPDRARRAVDLMSDHEETNPMIVDFANELRDRQDREDFFDGKDYEKVLDKWLSLALSSDPEDIEAFRSFWGLAMSIDGGDSLDTDPDDSMFRRPVLESLERITGSAEEARLAYEEIVSNYGGYPEFVLGKKAISDGNADLNSPSIAAGLFRLMAASARKNTKPLYRLIIANKNTEEHDTYTTPGSMFDMDSRSFTETPLDGSIFATLSSFGTDSDSERIIFKIDAGDGTAVSVDSVSWFGESEHLAHGTYQVVDVKTNGQQRVVTIKEVPRPPREEIKAENDVLSATGPRFTSVTQYGDISDWRQVGGQAGSNEGGFYNSPDGNEFYIKRAKSQSHADNEALASAFYKELGIDSTDVGFGDKDGELWVVTPLIPGAISDLDDKVFAKDKEYLDKIRQDMAVDAWLSNYDVVGLVYDNIVSDENGNPVRVDPGGALMWRARGSRKEFFTDEVNELDGLRDPDLNYAASQVFGAMTDDDVRESAKKLLDLPPSRIDEIIDTVVSDPDDAALLKERLKNRRQNILDRVNLQDQQDVDVLGPSTPITDAIGFEAQDLQPGDVTLGDAFTIEKIFRDADTPKGKVSVIGYFPGHESQRKEWNEKTNVPAVRGGALPEKGDKPALNRPKAPTKPQPPAFTGIVAEDLALARNWDEVADILRGRTLVFFDYETTGFPDPKTGDASTNQPVQLGAIKVEDGEIVDRLNIFMNPDEPLGGWSSANLKGPNGEPLTDSWLAEQISKADAHKQFMDWVGRDSILAAHNAPFDTGVLNGALSDAGIDYTPDGVIDTLRLAQQIVRSQKQKDNPDINGPERHTLGSLADYYGIPLEGWHTADVDSEATFKLLGSLLRDASSRDDGTLLGNVRDDNDRFSREQTEFDAASEEYKDALAEYVAAKAAAAAFNCGGFTAAADRDPNCNSPTLDEMIIDATPKSSDVENPDGLGTNGDAYTSGEDDLTPTPQTNPAGIDQEPVEETVSVSPAKSVAEPEFTEEERNSVIEAEYEGFSEFADDALGEDGNLKPFNKKKLTQAREAVDDIYSRLKSGDIDFQQAAKELSAVIDGLPEVPDNSKPENVDVWTFRDALVTLNSALTGEYWERPTGEGLPPKSAVDSKDRPVGFSKNGLFVTKKARVRDKWGFAGTVVKYDENNWSYVKVRWDIDPIKRENVKKGGWGPEKRVGIRNTHELTVLGPDDDQHPWIDNPKIPDKKRPEEIEEQLRLYNEKYGTNFEYKRIGGDDEGDEGPLGVKPKKGADGAEGGDESGEPAAGTTEALRKNVEERAKEAEAEAEAEADESK